MTADSTDNWGFGGGPPTSDGAAEITLVDGASFCISTANGDVRPGAAQGLFVRDARVLSRWELLVDGRPAQMLAVHHTEPFSATFLCRAAPRPGQADSTVLVQRSRHLGDGMREDVLLENLAPVPVTCEVTVRFAADFADLFEVKENRVAAGPEPQPDAAADGVVRLEVDRGAQRRGVRIMTSPVARTAPDAVTFTVELAARSRQELYVQVQPTVDGVGLPIRHPFGTPVAEGVPLARLAAWRSQGPSIRSGDAGVLTTIRRCQEDLGALRIFDPDHPDRAMVAAGAPWFMALFGRDSLLTAWMALPLSQRLALGTLQTLAAFQGAGTDPRTEEQPGRILHEVRFGPQATLALGGGTVYYGTADATPLFVMLLGELSRWGHDPADVDALLPHADRALEWVRSYGDRDGDGFVEYARSTDEGLVNQGWKDSWDGVVDASGAIAEPPIALCEVQGYVYAAYVARAHLARRAGDAEAAAHWREEARLLRERFHREFWLPDRGYYAVALDGDKRPVDALASNMGHCLWTGIVPPEVGDRVADALMSPELFSGWGIRTLATSCGGYNPMGYHTGSVWPHDSAIVAAGLMRYGRVGDAQRVARAVLDAAECFDGRLPELFCGFDRARFPEPVPYPTSCSPQAWAAGAPILLLRTLLRLEPSIPRGRLRIAPAVPPSLLPLTLENLPVGRHALSVDVTADGWSVRWSADDVALVEEPDVAVSSLLI